VLEKDGGHLDRSCEKREKYYEESRRTTIAYNNEIKTKWSDHMLRRKELPSETRYLRKDRSDGKTMKKT